MGTWGTGPLDNDTALDMLYQIEMDPPLYREIIRDQLMKMADVPLEKLREDDDLAASVQQVLAVCAVVADVKHSEHFYTSPPDSEDPDDFRLSHAERYEDLEMMARQAVMTCHRLVREVIDLGWRSRDDYTDHSAVLTGLEQRLS